MLFRCYILLLFTYVNCSSIVKNSTHICHSELDICYDIINTNLSLNSLRIMSGMHHLYYL